MKRMNEDHMVRRLSRVVVSGGWVRCTVKLGYMDVVKVSLGSTLVTVEAR